MSKFNKGDKVVPHSKSIVGPLSDSVVWRRANRVNQNYLYVIKFDYKENAIVANDTMDDDGDYFAEEDLTLYQEPPITNLNAEDLISGEVYYWKSDQYEYLARCKHDYKLCEHIYIPDNVFTNSEISTSNKTGFIDNFNWTIRVATSEEKKWLAECVRLNKYVDKSVIYEKSNSTIKPETNLEKAKRLYPVGTRIRCVKDGKLGTTVNEAYCDQFGDICSKYSRVEDFSQQNQYIYANGKWAEIIPDVETPQSITTMSSPLISAPYYGWSYANTVDTIGNHMEYTPSKPTTNEKELKVNFKEVKLIEIKFI